MTALTSFIHAGETKLFIRRNEVFAGDVDKPDDAFATWTDFQLSKQLSLTADYIRYQHYRPGTPDQNVVLVALNVRL